jgi:ABC-type transport system involved in multi-copper enzyme maturation permease subunit
MLLQLLRKDFRLNLVIVYAGLILSFLPYAFALGHILIFPPSENRPTMPHDYLEAAQTAAFACLAIVVLLSAAFGGLTFAGERRERTAEFLGMLPVTRGKIMLSKLIVPVVCIAVLTTLHALTLGFVNGWAWMSGRRLGGWSGSEAGTLTFAMSILVFALGWALSVYLRSPAIAASIALGLGFGAFFGGGYWLERFFQNTYTEHLDEDVKLAIVCLIIVVFSAIPIAVTAAHYARRVDP